MESQQFIRLEETDEVLNFPNVDVDKAGSYQCFATNDAGRDFHGTEVIVECKWYLYYVIVVSSLAPSRFKHYFAERQTLPSEVLIC